MTLQRKSHRHRSYTGTREAHLPLNWFRDVFGFEEGPSYEEVRESFVFGRGILVCKATNQVFTVGSFITPTLSELYDQLDASKASAPNGYWSQGGLTFRNVVGDTRSLHMDAANAGCVFQASSLFNCLQTGYGYGPCDGITRYATDATQGPAAAICCPAATVFRNYFVNMHGQGGSGQQIDCLSQVAALVDNDSNRYWTLRNGCCLPKVPGGIARLSKLLANSDELREQFRRALQVGVHWETEVAAPSKHTVCQVLCAALPVGLEKSVLAADWHPFAQAVLDAVYDAAIVVAATLAAQRGKRIKVYLTAVGSGWLGNRQDWIADAIDKALVAHQTQPLDIELVHYAELPPLGSHYAHLEEGRLPPGYEREPPADVVRTVTSLCATLELPKPERDTRQCMRQIFERYDLNGDGVLDRAEFTRLLQHADPSFFHEPCD